MWIRLVVSYFQNNQWLDKSKIQINLKLPCVFFFRRYDLVQTQHYGCMQFTKCCLFAETLVVNQWRNLYCFQGNFTVCRRQACLTVECGNQSSVGVSDASVSINTEALLCTAPFIKIKLMVSICTSTTRKKAFI